MAIIDKPSDFFNTVIWTGNNANGGTQTISGVGFQPDFTWIKSRTQTYDHALFDATRGATKMIESNTNVAEATEAQTLKSFVSNGFSIGTSNLVNQNVQNHVAWNWKANGQGSSNTDGSTNTTYTSVSTTAGFSISSYAGSSSNATIGHGLGVAPKMFIIKNLSGTRDWSIYHESLGNAKVINLNNTNAAGATGQFASTSPTSTVFTVAGDYGNVNESGANYIAYCFAEKQGYSKFGSYLGNGNVDGTFVSCGFKPAFILQKNTARAGSGWGMFDTTRTPTNVSKGMLIANSTAVEDTSDASRVDFLSNGFKWRTTDNWFNDNNALTIFMAFAENPFVASNFNPATAR